MSTESLGVPFVKATACGNDFILIESAAVPEEQQVELTRRICNRTYGVGADGVEWLYTSKEAHVRAHLINSDGSYAEISGNGTRCVAAHIYATTGNSTVDVETGAGVKTCLLAGQDGRKFRFRTAMGTPAVATPIELRLKTGELRGVPVNMGNPHFVTFVSTFPNNWQAIAAEVQSAPEFPNSTNVEFVKVLSDTEIEIRIYERGAGETSSSGTGSSAAAAASIASGRVQTTVTVNSPGGPQVVEWRSELLLDGPAELICSGEYWV